MTAIDHTRMIKLVGKKGMQGEKLEALLKEAREDMTWESLEDFAGRSPEEVAAVLTATAEEANIIINVAKAMLPVASALPQQASTSPDAVTTAQGLGSGFAAALRGEKPCPNCHHLVRESVPFCPNCGNPIGATSTLVCPIDGATKRGTYCDQHSGVRLIEPEEYQLVQYLMSGPRRMGLDAAIAVLSNDPQKKSLKAEMNQHQQRGGGLIGDRGFLG